MTVEAVDVVSLTEAVAQEGAQWCIVGGWGVDALVGAQTRPHKDLDVLVERQDLRAVLGVLTAAGFRHAYAWEENLPLDDDGDCSGVDAAFVMEDAHGRSVDIHVYARDEGGAVRMLWAVPDDVAAALALTAVDVQTEGRIAGRAVRCMSARAQLVSHTGYELPAPHRRDVELLQRVIMRS